LFKSSTILNTSYYFLTAQTNQSATAKFQAYVPHLTRLECRKSTSYLSLKTDISITKFTRPFYSASLNCPPFALTQALRRLRELTTDFSDSF